MKTPKLTPVQDLRIFNQLNEGARVAELMEEYDVTAPTIRAAARRAKYRIPPAKLGSHDLDHLIAHAKDVVMAATKGADIKAAIDALERLIALQGAQEEKPQKSQQVRPQRLALKAVK